MDRHVRKVQQGDLAPLLEMVQALAAHHGDVAQVTVADLARDMLGARPWVTTLVAQDQAGLAGYAVLCPLVQVQFARRGMDMHHLFVRADLRGQGVGRLLIDACIGEARAQGCASMTVGTHPDNAAAGAIYRAAGFSDLPPPGPRFRITL